MTAFSEFERKCFHCEGKGHTAGSYSHQVAIDLIVDAADAARFNADEARRLYRLAAKYEDSTADQLETDHRGRRLSKVPWTAAVHRRNALILRALADQDTLTDLHRRVVRIEMRIGRKPDSTMTLSVVKDAPA